MANLPTKQSRDAIGIDTVTRGLVWSTLYLRAVNLSSSTTFADYVIWSILDGKFYAEIKLVYSSLQSVISGLNFIPHIQAFVEGEIEGFIDTPNTPSVGEVLPVEPGTVDTVEKYLYWLCSVFAASTYPNLDYIKIEVFDGATKIVGDDTVPEPYLKITLNLPLNYKRYLITGNVIYSVEKVVNFYIDQDIEITANGVIIPSSQFWQDPVVSLSELTAIPSTDLPTGVTNPVTGLGQYFIFYRDVNAAPTGLTYYAPDDAEGSEGWIAVQGNAGGTITTINWSQVLNKPTFHSVAFDGNYNNLSNKPTIPTALNTLAGWNLVVRSVNGQTPDAGGNAQITVDVGSVTWENVENKPSLSGLDEWELVVRSVNGQTPDGSGNASVTVNASVEWANVQNKPVFAVVATSGSYNNLVDKPSIPDISQLTIETVTANKTITESDNGKFFEVNTSSSDVIFTLNNLTKTISFSLRKATSDSNKVILSATNLDAVGSKLAEHRNAASCIYNGNNWIAIGKLTS